jgi:hypothetical protein
MLEVVYIEKSLAKEGYFALECKNALFYALIKSK